MGQHHSTPMEDRPVVVVVGGGYAGIAAAKGLDDVANVVLIDRKGYFFHNVGAPRAVAVKGFQDSICIPYKKLLKKGTVVKADVTKITPTHVHLHGVDKHIAFDYLVIATGTSYAFPAKIPMHDAAEVHELFEEVQDMVAVAKSVVVIGGGAVGIELAGEIAAVHKGATQKKRDEAAGSEVQVTLIHSGDQLLSGRPEFAALGQKLKGQLEGQGVNVVVQERVLIDKLHKDGVPVRYLKGDIVVNTDKGRAISADVVFFCHGSSINRGCYEETFKGSMTEWGELKVNARLQVDGYKNVFAIGDCSNREAKLGFLAGMQGVHAANSIARIIKGATPKKYSLGMTAMIVPLGPENGSSLLPVLGVQGPIPTKYAKGRKLFVDRYWGELGFSKKEMELMGITTASEKDEEISEEQRAALGAAFGIKEEEVGTVIDQIVPKAMSTSAEHL